MIAPEEIEPAGTVGEQLAVRVLDALRRATAAEKSGDIERARSEFSFVYEFGLPMVEPLRECGRFFLRTKDFEKAYECFTVLDQLDPGVIFTFWAELPGTLKARFAPLIVGRLFLASRPRLYELQPVKAALVHALGEIGATMVLEPLMRRCTGSRILKGRVQSLHQYARANAILFEELVPPADVVMQGPVVFGRPRPPGLAGWTRSVFRCILPDVVVSSKSNLLLTHDRILMDYQGNELDSMEMNFDADPIVLGESGRVLTVMDDAEEGRREVDEAFTLVGVHSWNYGHWIVEFLFQLWLCMDKPGFDKVPLIIDEQMPQQLREALHAFAGSDHPVIVLRPGETVKVRRLWTCSRIAHWPAGIRPGSPYPSIFELANTAPLAEVVRGLSGLLREFASASNGARRRIYLRRQDQQARRMSNRVQVEAWFEANGFELLDFGSMSFREQVKCLWEAETVVGPDGSAFFGLLFARPGLRIGMLGQPCLETYEWLNAMFTRLGHRVLLLAGDLHWLNPNYYWQSGVTVNVEQLGGFLRALESDLPVESWSTEGPASAPTRLSATSHIGRLVPDDDDHQAEIVDISSSDESRAYQCFVRGEFARANAFFEGRDPALIGRVGSAIGAAARGQLAKNAGKADEAAPLFDLAFSSGVPLAGLLRAMGSHYAASPESWRKAYECYSLLEEIEPNTIIQNLWNMPPDIQRRHSPWAVTRLASFPRPLFYQIQPMKAALVDHFGMEAASPVIARMIHPGPGERVEEKPLVSLWDYARRNALRYEVVVPPADVLIRPPEVFGGADLPVIRGRSRTVFMAVLANISVHSKSNLLFAQDCVLMDYQGDELGKVPINLDVNPTVIGLRDGLVRYSQPDEKQGDVYRFDRAFSLLGLHTWAYGHWIFEYMFQIWACMRMPDFEDLPILVDDQMPAQMMDILRFFVGSEHPVHVIKRGQGAVVRELWTCSRIAYWPGGEKLPPVWVEDYELSNTKALATLIGGLQPKLDALERSSYPSRLYLTRKAAQGRALLNRDKVEAWFSAQGFAIVDFNELTYVEQLKHLRAADTIVLESGSSAYGALLCRKGTRIGVLDLHPMEFVWFSTMFEDLEMPMLMFPLDLVRPEGEAIGSEHASADLEKLEPYLQELMQGPRAGT